MLRLKLFWSRLPLLKLLVFWLLGALLIILWPYNLGYGILLGLMLLSCLGLMLAYFYGRAIGHYWLGRSLLLLFISMGALGMKVSLSQLNMPHFKDKINGKMASMVLRISDEPQTTAKNYRAIAQLISLRTDSLTLKQPSIKVLVYAKRDSFPCPFKYGDLLVLNSSINTIPGAMMPGAFDFKMFMAKKGIHFQTRLSDATSFKVIEQQDFSLRAAALQLKERFRQQLSSFQFHPSAKGIITALVTGDRRDIPEETKSQFQQTGTIHVLAVSGLHIGIIFLLLLRITFFFERLPNGKRWQTLLVLLILWLYAFFTGFSPSVTRAVIMFSFIAVGKSFNRHVSLLNIIACAALLMLTVNPLYLFDIGFILSYSALFGIVLLTPELCSLWQPKWKLLSWTWQLICATTAAQIFTLPVALFVFNQFPVYFLPANLIAIPLATITTSLGFVSFLFTLIPEIQWWLFYPLSWAAQWLDAWVTWVGHWPGALYSGFYFDEVQLVFLLLFMIFTLLVFHLRNVAAFYTAIASFTLLLIWPSFSTMAFNPTSQLVLLPHLSGPALLTIDHSRAEAHLHIDAAKPVKAQIRDVQQAAHSLKTQIAGVNYFPTGSFKMKIGGRELLYVHDSLPLLQPTDTFDLCIIDRLHKLPASPEQVACRCAAIVLANTLPRSQEGFWLKNMESKTILHHSMRNQGKFTMYLN